MNVIIENLHSSYGTKVLRISKYAPQNKPDDVEKSQIKLGDVVAEKSGGCQRML